MMLNQRIVTVKITRKELCNLMLACTCAKHNAGDDGAKWAALHDTLKEQLDAFDEKVVK